MSIGEFLKNCHGDVCIHLTDGSHHTGRFRTDILSPHAVSAYFFGDVRDLSLPIGLVESIEHLPEAALAS
jgi:hypothetical protein